MEKTTLQWVEAYPSGLLTIRYDSINRSVSFLTILNLNTSTFYLPLYVTKQRNIWRYHRISSKTIRFKLIQQDDLTDTNESATIWLVFDSPRQRFDIWRYNRTHISFWFIKQRVQFDDTFESAVWFIVEPLLDIWWYLLICCYMIHVLIHRVMNRYLNLLLYDSVNMALKLVYS